MADTKGITEVKTTDVHTNGNIRIEDATADAGLIASVEWLGITQPIVVKPATEGYTLLTGHRRLDAAKRLNLATVPVRVLVGPDIPTTDAEVLALQFSENYHREDMTELEIAQASWDLKVSGLNQKQVAKTMGVKTDLVSAYQKIGKAFADDETMDETAIKAANTMTFDGLFDVAKGADKATPSRVVQHVVEDNQYVSNAISKTADEEALAVVYAENAESLKAWSESGIEISEVTPSLQWGRTNAYGGASHNQKVRRLEGKNEQQRDELKGIKVTEHLDEVCHMVFVQTKSGWNSEIGIEHWCMDFRRHEDKGNSKLKSNTAKDRTKAKSKTSLDRKAAAIAKADRMARIQRFVTEKLTKGDIVALALESTYEDVTTSYDYKLYAEMLGLEVIKTEGFVNDAETAVDKYLTDKFKDDDTKRYLFIINLSRLRAYAKGDRAYSDKAKELVGQLEVYDIKGV